MPESSSPVRAVILVAGMGTRLGPRTLHVPKCLTRVGATPIVVNALHHLEAVGVRETVLVVGYMADVVQHRVGSELGRMRIVYRTNNVFEATGTTRSLWLGLDGLREDVLVLEGDVFFDASVLARLLAAPPDATLVERWTPRLDGSVVELDADANVRAWIHKKDRPPGFSPGGTYKTVNIHRFSRAFLDNEIRPALDFEIERDGGREPLETPLARIVAGGGRIHAVDAGGRWVEIDDENDLKAAEAMFGGIGSGSR
jgi:NDP-sugar pyrophosphorylase family protein